MNHIRFIICIPLILAANHPVGASDVLHAGVAIKDITPPIPFRMSGYFMERLSTGTIDPLHAKAGVFRQGDESAALVFCDLVGISLDVSTAARRKSREATGIPAGNIGIAATHSHTGPLYFGALSDYFHQRNVTKFGNDPYDPADYIKPLIDKIVAAIVEAKRNLQPIELSSGNVREDRLSFNRRFQMKDGSVRFNPGELNPNIVQPAGPIDPEVGIIGLNTPGAGTKTPFAAIVSFALHLDTVSGTEYSPDYPKFVEDEVHELLGYEFTLLFGAGTCGDINHIDVSTRERRKTEQIGQMLGERVGKAIGYGTLSRGFEPALAVRSVKIGATLQSYSEGEIAQARKNLDLVGTGRLPFLEQVEAYKIIDLQRRKGDTLPLEVQAFRLNSETAIVTLPAEVFVELGLAIIAASPFETTLVIELANDSLGYIPTRKAFAEGSYEIVNSRVEAGTGERLVEAAVGLLKELE